MARTARVVALFALVLHGCPTPLEPLRPAPACDADPRAEAFGSWLTRRTDGGGYSVIVERATPSPPRGGDNEWALRVVALAAEGGTIEAVRLIAAMPDDALGRFGPRHFEATPGAGTRFVASFHLPLAGLWALTVEVRGRGGVERAPIVLCIDRRPLDAGVPEPRDADVPDAERPDGEAPDARVPPPCVAFAPTECRTPDTTYADVAPIFAERCAVCHDGSADEWPLTTYGHVVDWADDIRSHLLDCTMPPDDADVAMLDEERQVVLDWLRCGMPR
ncbi:MAG: hypothetical protein KF729_04845 [Sandaracinaceae bacterium]|nr:hypothetical protein [Sandaracinaceae bacterium]